MLLYYCTFSVFDNKNLFLLAIFSTFFFLKYVFRIVKVKRTTLITFIYEFFTLSNKLIKFSYDISRSYDLCSLFLLMETVFCFLTILYWLFWCVVIMTKVIKENTVQRKQVADFLDKLCCFNHLNCGINQFSPWLTVVDWNSIKLKCKLI